ncbi:MAG: RnfABCDGE type electron transport complex subunit G [Desulfovibrio sp.]|uniref:RnfABCDGE type electron transport complex subunit G n=1 Tax=Desulfovibrio sp. 7SRBS1 TaxID=3378064 RepID=UPI003B40552C
MRETLRMLVVLTLICGVSGYSLATLKKATRQRIESQVLTYVQGPALLGVLTQRDNDPIADRKPFALDDSEILVFPAFDQGKLTGIAFEAFAPGYSGDIGLMVGFDPATDKLVGIGVTTQTETPGIGTRILEKSFTSQFKNHGLKKLDVRSKDGDLDGVTGATYSTTGVMAAVQKAAKLYTRLKPEIIKTWPQGDAS